MRRAPFLLTFFLVWFLYAPAAWGEAAPVEPKDLESSEAPKDWEFKTAPYIWLVFMTGDAAIGGTSVPVDTNVFKIFDSTDFAFGLQGHFEAWYRRKWGLLFDGTWVVFKQKNLMGGTPLQLDIKGNYGLMEFAGLYNFLDIPFGTEPDGPILSLQGLAGARVSIVSMDLDFDFAGSMDESVTWADPILGGRSIYRFGNERRWAFTFRWDVGGFGAGSDFTWNLAGLLGYDFHIGSVPATAIIGAKALYQDFEDGSGPDDFKWDVTQYGPLWGWGSDSERALNSKQGRFSTPPACDGSPSRHPVMWEGTRLAFFRPASLSRL